jgi:DNA-binding MarR family transcriptional regulator
MMVLLDRLFDEVRLLEHRLVQVAEKLHSGAGVTIPGRAVLEYLLRCGPTSVPDIARARYVSRQHIQTIVDTLADAGLVQSRPNPAHRRSPLFTLTDSGASAITAIHERERQLLKARLTGIDRDEVAAAVALLTAVRGALDDQEAP